MDALALLVVLKLAAAVVLKWAAVLVLKWVAVVLVAAGTYIHPRMGPQDLENHDKKLHFDNK